MLKQRVLPILLLFLLLVPMALSACSSQLSATVEQTAPMTPTQQAPGSSGQESAPDPSEAQPTLSPADSYLASLESMDYQGREVKIAVYHSKTIFPSDSKDVIDDLALTRNEKVEKKYNVSLNEVAVSDDNFFENLHKDLLAGTTSCDMVVAPVAMLDLFVTYSFYTNVNTLGIDYSAPYYDQGAMNALTTGAVTYAVVGDYTASPEQSHCVFYNQNVLSANGLDNISSLVKDGTWTWQTLMDYCKQATGKNAALKMEYGVSSSCDESEFIRMFWASSGVPYFENVAPYKPVLSLEDKTVDPIVKLVKNIRTSAYYYGAEQKKAMEAIDSFRYGSTLFYISEVGDYSKLLNNEFTIGFAPLPKTSAEQAEYSTYTDNSFQAVFVLPDCPDVDLTATMIEALNASSYRLVDNAYLNLYMHMYLSSNAEGLMLRDIINRPYYDLAYLMDDSYSGGFSSVSTDMIYRVVTAGVKFRTVFKQSEKQFRRFLETYRKTFGYLEGTPGETTVAPTTTVAATTVPVAATTAAKPTKPPVVTSPKPTAPKPTSKPTAAPATTKAPATTAKPKPTVPATTAAPATTVAQTTTVVVTTVPATTVAPATTAPITTAPVVTAPATTAPVTTVPAATVPATTVAPTVPATTVSASAAPSAVASSAN